MNRWWQAKQLWNVYNNQESYNKYWILLFAYLLLFIKIIHKKRTKNNYILKKKVLENSVKIRSYLEEHLIDTYRETWKQACKLIGKDIPLPDEEEIKSIVNETWVGDKNFKARQAANTNKFLDKLKELEEDNKLDEDEKLVLKKKLVKQYRYTVYRLTRTETSRVINTASLRAYESGGISYVEWVTAEDERVCEICRPRDRKIYEISLAPSCPDHPNCRCVLIPYIKDEEEY